jgi:hypothetical protein
MATPDLFCATISRCVLAVSIVLCATCACEAIAITEHSLQSALVVGSEAVLPENYLTVLVSIRSRLKSAKGISSEEFMRLQSQILDDKMIADEVGPLAVPIIVDTFSKLAIAAKPELLGSCLKSKKVRHIYLLAACGVRVASRECVDKLQSQEMLRCIEGMQFAQDDEREPIRRMLCKEECDQEQALLVEKAVNILRLRYGTKVTTERNIAYALQFNLAAVEFIAISFAIPSCELSVKKIYLEIKSQCSDMEREYGHIGTAEFLSWHFHYVTVGLTFSLSDTDRLRSLKKTLFLQFIRDNTSRVEVPSLGEQTQVHFALCELYLCEDVDAPQILRRIANLGTNVSDESDLPAYFGYSPTPTHFLASVVVRPSVGNELLECYRSNDSAKIHAGIALTYLFGPSLTLCDSRLVGSLGDVLKSAVLPQPLSREDILEIISLQTHE